MINKTKKFHLLIVKITSILNDIISEINNNSKKQSLYCHSIIIKLNQENNTLNFYINEKLLAENEIKIDQQNYLNEIVKQLNELLNKMHFLNNHIRMVISDDKTNQNLLELPSESLKIPKFSEIPQNFWGFYGEKKLDKENFLVKRFSEDNDKYKIVFNVCYIYHNFAKYGTFDLLLFNNRLYDINLSKNENIIKELKNRMFFDLSGDNIFINFNKLKDSSINLFIVGNYKYTKKEINNKETENSDDEINEMKNKQIIEFIINSMNTINEEFYERIKLFSENKKMNFYFDTITSCLKEIYTTTNDPQIFDVYSKLFETSKDDPQYIQKKLSKNFMLCSLNK